MSKSQIQLGSAFLRVSLIAIVLLLALTTIQANAQTTDSGGAEDTSSSLFDSDPAKNPDREGGDSDSVPSCLPGTINCEIPGGVTITAQPSLWSLSDVPGLYFSNATYSRVDSFSAAPADPNTQGNTNPCANNGATPNPVILSTGMKVEPETDFIAEGEMPLELVRIYNQSYSLRNGIFGQYWISSFDHALGLGTASGVCFNEASNDTSCGGTLATAITSLVVYRSDGSTTTFHKNATGQWVDSKPVSIENIVLVGGQGGNWVLTNEDGSVETYEYAGRIISVVDQFGVGWTYQYGSPNKLTSILHSSGRSVQIGWNTTGQVATVTDPAGNVYSFSYNNNLLSGVTRPVSSGQSESVTYGYQSIPGYWGLTSVSYNGVQYKQITYNTSTGAVKTSGLAGGVEQDTFSFTPTTTTVTNSAGATTIYSYSVYSGQKEPVSIQRSGVTGCPTVSKSTSYQGPTYFVSSKTDFNDVETDYNYNGNGQAQSITTGILSGDTSNRREAAYQWNDPRVNAPTQITIYGADLTTAISQTVYVFVPDGTPGSKRIQSITATNKTAYGIPNQARTTSYTYTIQSNNLPSKIIVDGPLPGTGDALTYNYDSYGQLTSVVNGLGQQISYGNYNGLGEPGYMTDANGLTTTYTYDGRGRLSSKSSTVSGVTRTATYTYTALGKVASLIYSPSNTATYYTYDAAGRLTAITQDPYGSNVSQIAYTYDSLSDVTKIAVLTTLPVCQNNSSSSGGPQAVSSSQASPQVITYYSSPTVFLTCPSGTTWVSSTFSPVYSVNMTYDQVGHMLTKSGNNNQLLTYTYDPEGNVLSVKDALNRLTSYAYNAQNQVKQTTDAAGGITHYTYDGTGNLESVQDPKGLTTLYYYDGLGNLAVLSSPDSGTTSYVHDAAGVTTSITRQDGSTVNYSGADALGRYTSITAGSSWKTLVYDSCSNGVGRLCSFSDPSGQTSYTYTPTGQIASQTNVIGSNTFTTGWAYDTLDRVATLTYPGGNQVSYTYNAHQQLTSMSAVIGGTATTVVSAFTYEPFGPAIQFNYGNGITRTLGYDYDRRLLKLTGGMINNYTFDKADQVTAFGNNSALAYDNLGRLTTVTSSDGNQSIGYDSNGNRTAYTLAGAARTYTPSTSSNQIASISGGVTETYNYDPLGNEKTESGSRGNFTYTYDGFNHLSSVSSGSGIVNYSYNALGQRVSKSGSVTATFIYGPDGALLGEASGGSSTLSNEYVWMGGQLVGLIYGGQLYAVHTDHLGRPQEVTNSAKTIVWVATNTPFNRTVSINSIGTSLNIAFPGQYYDAESGLYYNMNRYYDPTTGRYIQSDPIGLAGGINTYTYALNRPTMLTDPFGLDPCGCKSVGQNFADNFKDDWKTTNSFFFSFPTSLSRSAISALSGSAALTADAIGGVTLFQALGSLPSGGLAFYGGVGGTLVAGGVGWAANTAVVAGSLEAGITAGSVLNAAVQTAMDQFACH